MTLLDVMIAAGGLTDFAAGNRATLVRTADGAEQEYRVRLDDLLRDGDISANVAMRPGDVVIIPETFFEDALAARVRPLAPPRAASRAWPPATGPDRRCFATRTGALADEPGDHPRR